MRGAIVSLDRSRPYGTWRWGGPEWTGRMGAGAPGQLAGITVAVSDPVTVAARWAQVLGLPVSGEERSTLHLDGADVEFVSPGRGGAEGLQEIAVQLPSEPHDGSTAIQLGGVNVRLIDPISR
jgi:hypothetical protein